MYKFVYWFFYEFFIWRKGFESSFVASSIVGLAIVLHLVLIYSLVKQFTGWTVTPFLVNFEYGVRKWVMILSILPLFFALDFLYFRRRKDAILDEYREQEPFSTKNIAFILLLMLMPLVMIFVLN